MSESNISYGTMTSFVERDTAGKLDFDATMTKFAAFLTEYESAVETEMESIGEAVNMVFDKWNTGSPVNMDAIVSLALTTLNPTPANHNILRDRIKEYVRINSDRHEKKDKDGNITVAAEAPRTRAFVIAKGKGGGVKRWKDVEVKPAE